MGGGTWGEQEEEEERGSLGKNVWNSFPVLQLSQSPSERGVGVMAESALKTVI